MLKVYVQTFPMMKGLRHAVMPFSTARHTLTTTMVFHKMLMIKLSLKGIILNLTTSVSDRLWVLSLVDGVLSAMLPFLWVA